jgi:hypothetical protein
MKILFKNRKTIEFLSGLDELSGNADMKQTLQVELDVPLNTARESLWVKFEQGFVTISHEILFNYAYTAIIPEEVIRSPGEWTMQLFVREYDFVSGSYITKATSQKATFTMPESMQLEDGTLVTNATVANLYAGQAQLGERTGAIDERLGDLELDYKETVQDLRNAEQHLADAEKDIRALAGTVGGFDGRIKHAEELVEGANERSQQNASDIVGLRQDFVNESHFRGYVETDAEFETLYGNANDYAYSLQSGTTWVYQQDNGWVNTGKPAPTSAAPLSNATPLVDGEASAGTATAAARGDHRHPSDPTKVSFTDIASQDKAGVVKISTIDYGLELQNGTLRVRQPSDWNIINARDNGNNSPITLSKADLALKECLINPLVEYTDEDKAKACETIGATPKPSDSWSTAYSGGGIAVLVNGEWKKMTISGSGGPYNIAMRQENGVLNVGTPTADSHATNKKYVDDNKGTKWYKHVVIVSTPDGTRFFTLVSPVSSAYTDIKTFGKDCLLYGAILEFAQGFTTKVTSGYINGTEEAGYSVIVGFADDSDGFGGLDITGINNDTVTAL